MRENCYIYFDYEVINEVLKSRELQTSEYKMSNDFVSCLFSSGDTGLSFQSIEIVKYDGGTFCFRKDKKDTRGVVIDLDQLTELQNKDAKDKLAIVLKVLRFGVKFWNNHPMTNSELRIQDSTSFCLMPLPFTTSNYYKILVETKPDTRRMERRSLEYLVCYKDGHNKPPVSEAGVTNLRKALATLDTAFSLIVKKPQVDDIYDFGRHNTNTEKIETEIKGYIGYDNWGKYITETQKRFVFNKTLSSSRIEGPAGSGKTLSLILRAIFLLKKHQLENIPFHIIFITHSMSTKEAIKSMIASDLGSTIFDRHGSLVSINVTTLLEWCIENGNMRIGLSDCLEPDALDSKQMQLLYIEEVFGSIFSTEYKSTYHLVVSEKFGAYLESIDDFTLFDSLQKEFAIFIKGQANQDIDKYKEIEKSVFPISEEEDKAFIFRIFKAYQAKLEEIGQFDVDDVILSTMGSLNTPIWKRIRNSQGFDYIILDETQLFNFNELSILQYINRESCRDHICFSQDVSQSLGDIGFDSRTFERIGDISLNKDDSFSFGTVFRCSPEIAEVAFKILTSSPTLLTDTNNPLDKIEIVSSSLETVVMPFYFEHDSDTSMIEFTYKRVDKLIKRFGLSRSDVLIVATDHRLLEELEKLGRQHNKPILFIEKRGDRAIVESARSNSMYVGSMIDFVGGLEFEAVVMLGVDGLRVPPNNERATHFQQQAWVNKLYVATTRAKKILEINGNRTYPPSSLIRSALESESLVKKTLEG